MLEASGERHRTSLKLASSAECTDSNDLAVVTRRRYCYFLPFEFKKTYLKMIYNLFFNKLFIINFLNICD